MAAAAKTGGGWPRQQTEQGTGPGPRKVIDLCRREPAAAGPGPGPTPTPTPQQPKTSLDASWRQFQEWVREEREARTDKQSQAAPSALPRQPVKMVVYREGEWAGSKLVSEALTMKRLSGALTVPRRTNHGPVNETRFITQPVVAWLVTFVH